MAACTYELFCQAVPNRTNRVLEMRFQPLLGFQDFKLLKENDQREMPATKKPLQKYFLKKTGYDW